MKARGMIDYDMLHAELCAALGHREFLLSGESVKNEDGSDAQIARVAAVADPLDEPAVQAVLDAHVAAGPRRAALAAIDKQITELEAKSKMPRVLRDVVLASAPDSKGKRDIAAIEAQLSVLREQRRIIS